MPNFKVQVREGITTGTLYKTAIIEADSKEEAKKMLLDDGCEGPYIDWDEDYDVEFDSTPEYAVEEMA